MDLKMTALQDERSECIGKHFIVYGIKIFFCFCGSVASVSNTLCSGREVYILTGSIQTHFPQRQ